MVWRRSPMMVNVESGFCARSDCIKALTSIKRGIDMLDERHQVPRPATDGTGGTGQLSVEPEATEAASTP